MNLIWQFHVDTKRGYDGKERRRMAVCSSNIISAYALEVGATYMLETKSVFYSGGHHGGPAMDRFQLLDEKYDFYEDILYLDTDVLLAPPPQYKNIFKHYSGCDVAGHNIVHARDLEILEKGWLKGAVDPDRYKKSYFHGNIFIISKRVREWLRKNVDPFEINADKGKHWDTHGVGVKWPVYDQSLFAFWIANSPFNLTPLSEEFTSGSGIIHEGGGKSDTTTTRFFEKHKQVSEDWQRYMSIPESKHDPFWNAL